IRCDICGRPMVKARGKCEHHDRSLGGWPGESARPALCGRPRVCMRLMKYEGGGYHKSQVQTADDIYRNRRQVIAEPALVVKSGMKWRLGEIVTQFGDDASAQEDAATSTKGQRDIGCGSAEYCAENVQGSLAVRARSLERALTDL